MAGEELLISVRQLERNAQLASMIITKLVEGYQRAMTRAGMVIDADALKTFLIEAIQDYYNAYSLVNALNSPFPPWGDIVTVYIPWMTKQDNVSLECFLVLINSNGNLPPALYDVLDTYTAEVAVAFFASVIGG